jgi:hypothetical protein
MKKIIKNKKPIDKKDKPIKKITKKITKNKSKIESNYLIDKNDCAPCQAKENKSNKKFKSCYSKDSLIKIAQTWNQNNSNKIIYENKSKKSIWDQIQKNLQSSCNRDEKCWKKQEFIKKMKNVEIEMYTFKPKYPNEWLKDKYTWLNTYDIYYVMKQYEKANDDFVFLGPIPSDCPVKINCELSKLDIMKMKKNGINKIGIIYNLDVSTGPGTHWTGLYIDNKKNEINYYDSYGSKPTPLISKFIKKIVDIYQNNNIKPTVIYNDTRHQYAGSECGMYSMNFVLERLHGTSMYDISKMKIPDEKMNYLRKLLYISQ